MSKGDITKKEIARSFKELMEEKAFERITISDIMGKCGLNRLTFYHHFQDKYALLDWIYYNEIIDAFRNDRNFDQWPQKLCNALTVIKDNEKYYRSTINYRNEEFTRYVLDATTEVFFEVFETITNDEENKEIDEVNKEFIARFFSHGITGMIVDWLQRGMKETPEELSTHLQNLLDDCKFIAISRYLKDKIPGAAKIPDTETD
mgnify:CR=1 FL=1